MKAYNFFDKFKFTFVSFCFFLFSIYPIAYPSDYHYKKSKLEVFKPVIDSLVSKGIDTESVLRLIYDKRTTISEKYARINIFNRPKLEFENIITQKNVEKIEKFINQYREILSQAEKKFSVSKEVIATILFLETRLGKNLGQHHIITVFLNVAIGNNPKYVENYLKEEEKNIVSIDSLRNLISERSTLKAKNALSELLALIQMQKEFQIDILSIHGSFSGAFGICQFLPTSYISFGYDGNKDGKIDLFSYEDAIFSVSNYLTKNGWDEKDSIAQFNALFKYNRSKAYVEAILRISRNLIIKKPLKN
ncbi:MAG: lytic murein transglycosylase [Ignavibacteria bacterium]|nr:lytic murein transglycosylase [Ignavibacteria bacterium]